MPLARLYQHVYILKEQQPTPLQSARFIMQSADRLAIDPPISYDQDFYAWTQQMAIALRQKNWTYPYPSCKGAAFSQIFLKMAEK